MMETLKPCADKVFNGQVVNFEIGAEAHTSPWPAGPTGVLLTSTKACFVKAGEDVVASIVVDTYLPANTPILLKIPRSSNGLWRVSVFPAEDGGALYCKPCTQ